MTISNLISSIIMIEIRPLCETKKKPQFFGKASIITMDRVLGIFLCKLISQGRHVYALIWLLWTLLGLGYAHTPLLLMHLIT